MDRGELYFINWHKKITTWIDPRSLEQRKAVIDTSLMYLDKDKIYCYNIICDESVAVKRLIERKNKGKYISVINNVF